MTSELGVRLNKMPPLSRCLLVGSKHCDLPPPLVPLLSPATNQVCQTTLSLSQENGRLLGEKKGTEDEQSLKKKAYTLLALPQCWNICAFPLLCGCSANVSGWCLEYEPVVVFGVFIRGSEPRPGPLGIDILCKSMAAEADFINLSMLHGIDAGLCCHTRWNEPFDVFSEMFVGGKFACLLKVFSGLLYSRVTCHWPARLEEQQTFLVTFKLTANHSVIQTLHILQNVPVKPPSKINLHLRCIYMCCTHSK